MNANRNFFYVSLTLFVGALVSMTQWGLPVYAAGESMTSTTSQDVGAIRKAIRYETLADMLPRPTRLTCLDDECSKIRELPDLTLINGNRVRLENVDASGRIVGNTMTERYRIVVTSPSGFASSVLDTEPGAPLIDVISPRPKEQKAEKSYGLVDDVLTALHNAVMS